jgi:FAD-linked sulfhydryl oxidase
MNNIDPKIWGPSTWNFLYYVSLSYPDSPTLEDKKNTREFFKLVGKVLPCQTCRNNYYKHINQIPITNYVLSSRYNLINWLISIHNQVNISNNKPLITYDMVLKRYLNQNNNIDYTKLLMWISILLILIVILVIIIKYCVK